MPDNGPDKATVPAATRARLVLAPALLAGALLAAACGNTPSASSQAGSLVSKGLAAAASGNTHQAISDFRSAAAKDRGNAVPYYQLGVLYQKTLHDPTQAATAYKKALTIQPKDRDALFNLAEVDTATDPQASENLYNEILLLHPKDATTLLNLGVLLIVENQPIPGHAALKRAIALDPALAHDLPPHITP
jgi:Flp pilus assembly protein TadD